MKKINKRQITSPKIADLETPILTLVQSEGANQHNREKKTKENFVYMYTCYLSCRNFWKKLTVNKETSDLRRKHSRLQLQLREKAPTCGNDCTLIRPSDNQQKIETSPQYWNKQKIDNLIKRVFMPRVSVAR